MGFITFDNSELLAAAQAFLNRVQAACGGRPLGWIRYRLLSGPVEIGWSESWVITAQAGLIPHAAA